MELLAQGARFYEMLGYLLAVLAVGILCGGVIWSLRVHVTEKHRTFFLVASLAALSTLCGGVLLLLVFSQLFSPGTLDVQPPQRIDRGSARVEPTDHVQMIEVLAKPDGTVVYRGQAITVERLVPRLRREHPNKRLNVTVRADAETKYVTVMTVINHLQQQGVEQFAFRVSD